MKILEIKNNLVKISYDLNDNLMLSGFVIIEDSNSPYVAQVVNLKAENNRNYAVLRLLFTFDDEGVLKKYNGTIPSLEASVTNLPVEELSNIMSIETPIYLGMIAQQNAPFRLDISTFESNLLVCSNNVDNTSKLLDNIFPQIVDAGGKTVLIDVNGDFSSADNFIFGKNFKLPLNAKFLDFIFENDLVGVEAVSKAIIQDIFREVQHYIAELPQGYLPIDSFIDVVQQQYQETGIAELVLLKNKLLKYKEENIFASTNDDVEIFRNKVAHSDSLIVDISNVEIPLQKLLIPYLFDSISTVSANIFVLISVNNDIADKKLLRKTLEFRNVYTTIICPHEFKYLPDLKQIIQNLILFAPQTVQHDFAHYNTFLNKLNSDEFIVFGASTHDIPFIVQLTTHDKLVELQKIQQKVTASVEFTEREKIDEQSVVETESIDDSTQNQIADEKFLEPEIEELSETDFTPSFKNDEEEIVSENINSFEQEVIENRQELEDQVAKDVDAAFYRKIDEEPIDPENDINPQIFEDSNEMEELSENDLDFIESIPFDDEGDNEVYPSNEIEQDVTDFNDLETSVMDEEVIDELNMDVSTANLEEENSDVPIYTPEESIVDAPAFESGDVISHPKYGQGVVEKMINYGNKTLCSISFVNIGRRLLDPSLSELKLLSRNGISVN